MNNSFLKDQFQNHLFNSLSLHSESERKLALDQAFRDGIKDLVVSRSIHFTIKPGLNPAQMSWRPPRVWLCLFEGLPFLCPEICINFMVFLINQVLALVPFEYISFWPHNWVPLSPLKNKMLGCACLKPRFCNSGTLTVFTWAVILNTHCIIILYSSFTIVNLYVFKKIKLLSSHSNRVDSYDNNVGREMKSKSIIKKYNGLYPLS